MRSGAIVICDLEVACGHCTPAPIRRYPISRSNALSAIENRQLMERIFAGLAVADSRLYVDSLAEDIVMRVTGQDRWSHTFRGKAALMKDLYGYLRTRVIEAGKTRALRFIADDEHVAVEARGDMVTKEGVRYANEYCLVFRLHAGKIVEMREYCDSVLTEAVLGKFPSRTPTSQPAN